jgi:desulfoferrodoxin (superoxide reductase-like protein)
MDWYYIRVHPITEDRHVAHIELVFNEVKGEWDLPEYQPVLPSIDPETDFFRTRDEALKALAEGTWRRESTEEDDDSDLSGRGAL